MSGRKAGASAASRGGLGGSPPQPPEAKKILARKGPETLRNRDEKATRMAADRRRMSDREHLVAPLMSQTTRSPLGARPTTTSTSAQMLQLHVSHCIHYCLKARAARRTTFALLASEPLQCGRQRCHQYGSKAATQGFSSMLLPRVNGNDRLTQLCRSDAPYVYDTPKVQVHSAQPL